MKNYKNYLPIYGIYYMWSRLECEKEEFQLNLLLHIIAVICMVALNVC